MPRCYKCNNELVEQGHARINESGYALNHKEHIIPNGLHGKLKVEDILCAQCGSQLGTDIDAPFCSLFDLITVQLSDAFVKKDHGKSGRSKILRGYLYKDNTLKEKIDINYKDRCVTPDEPYYEYDTKSKELKLYANTKRIKQFETVVLKELEGNGVVIQDISIEYITNIQDTSILGLHFTEGVDDFNGKLRKGICKIAIGFALSNGISRDELKNVLQIKNDSTSDIVHSNVLIPFFPLSPFDRFVEENRPSIENNYPTHEIVLFSQPYSDNTKKLYCYVSLFGTFQYYVMLNDDYKGEDVYEVYYQTVLKQEIPSINIKGVRPKYLNVVIDELGIDMSGYKGATLSDKFDFVEQEYKKLTPNYQLDINQEIKQCASVLMTSFILSKNEEKENIKGLLNADIIESLSNISPEQTFSFLFEIQEINTNRYPRYKTCFYEDAGDGRLEILSYPDELIKEANRNEHIFKVYGHMKFNQLYKFVELNK